MIDEALADQVRVTVIATGFDKSSRLASGRRVRRRHPRHARPQIEDTGTGEFELPKEALEIPSFLRES